MNGMAQHTDSSIIGRSWKRPSQYWDWDAIPFLAIHLMCLLAFQTGIRWEWVILAIGSYYLRMVAVTAGYHRYFSHRSYKTSRLFQFLIAFLAMTSAQKGVLWWAAHHRHHHKFSDQEEDIHSPLQRGFWFSHVGWILSAHSVQTDMNLVRDFRQYPEICFLNRFYFIPPLVYALLIYSLHFNDRAVSLYILHQFPYPHDRPSQVQVQRRE
jgi:stearoyl-CoA desaturase (Delta-9 desaturase)